MNLISCNINTLNIFNFCITYINRTMKYLDRNSNHAITSSAWNALVDQISWKKSQVWTVHLNKWSNLVSFPVMPEYMKDFSTESNVQQFKDLFNWKLISITTKIGWSWKSIDWTVPNNLFNDANDLLLYSNKWLIIKLSAPTTITLVWEPNFANDSDKHNYLNLWSNLIWNPYNSPLCFWTNSELTLSDWSKWRVWQDSKWCIPKWWATWIKTYATLDEAKQEGWFKLL